MNLRLDVQYTYAEYVEAQRAHRKAEQKGLGRGMWGWAIFVGLTVMLILVLRSLLSAGLPPTTAPATDDGSPAALLGDVLPWLVIFIVIWVVGYRYLRGQMKRMWDGSPHLQQPRVLTISDERFTDATALTSHAYQWAAFVQYRETANLFVLYPGPFMIEMVPKRAFPGPADVDAFRAFLQGAINPQQPAFAVLPPQR